MIIIMMANVVDSLVNSANDAYHILLFKFFIYQIRIMITKIEIIEKIFSLLYPGLWGDVALRSCSHEARQAEHLRDLPV